MDGFLSNRWNKIGLALVIFGWGPLLLIILLAAIGLWPNPTQAVMNQTFNKGQP